MGIVVESDPQTPPLATKRSEMLTLARVCFILALNQRACFFHAKPNTPSEVMTGEAPSSDPIAPSIISIVKRRFESGAGLRYEYTL